MNVRFALMNSKRCSDIKILKWSGESLLISTLPAWCKNCFSLFQFVLVNSTFGILTWNFNTKLITLSPFIWHLLFFTSSNVPSHISVFFKMPFKNLWSVTTKDQYKTAVLQELPIKQCVWKLMCVLPLLVWIVTEVSQDFVRCKWRNYWKYTSTAVVCVTRYMYI